MGDRVKMANNNIMGNSNPDIPEIPWAVDKISEVYAVLTKAKGPGAT